MTIDPTPQEPNAAAVSADPMVFQRKARRPFLAVHPHPYSTQNPRVIPPSMVNYIHPIRSIRPTCSRYHFTSHRETLTTRTFSSALRISPSVFSLHTNR